jgi:hypothetical protein
MPNCQTTLQLHIPTALQEATPQTFLQLNNLVRHRSNRAYRDGKEVLLDQRTTSRCIPPDKSKLEMCFDCTNYQSQFPEKVLLENPRLPTPSSSTKTATRNSGASMRWTRARSSARTGGISSATPFMHYLFVISWLVFLQGRKHTRYAASWNSGQCTRRSRSSAALRQRQI